MSEDTAVDVLVESVKHLIMALQKEQIVTLRDWMQTRFDAEGNEHPYNAGA